MPLTQFAFSLNVRVSARQGPPIYLRGQKYLYLSEEILGPSKISPIFTGPFYEQEALLGKLNCLILFTFSVIISRFPGPSTRVSWRRVGIVVMALVALSEGG